jgi:hypothetical protein
VTNIQAKLQVSTTNAVVIGEWTNTSVIRHQLGFWKFSPCVEGGFAVLSWGWSIGRFMVVVA